MPVNTYSIYLYIYILSLVTLEFVTIFWSAFYFLRSHEVWVVFPLPLSHPAIRKPLLLSSLKENQGTSDTKTLMLSPHAVLFVDTCTGKIHQQIHSRPHTLYLQSCLPCGKKSKHHLTCTIHSATIRVVPVWILTWHEKDKRKTMIKDITALNFSILT